MNSATQAISRPSTPSRAGRGQDKAADDGVLVARPDAAGQHRLLSRPGRRAGSDDRSRTERLCGADPVGAGLRADRDRRAQDATSAAAIIRERQDLEKQLLDLQGDTELARDPRSQQMIWRRRKPLQLMGQFNAASDAARHGDQSAASSLPELSKALLDAAAQAATSQQELSRVQAQTAASLQATYDMIHAATMASSGATSGILGADTSAADGANWWNSYAPSNNSSGSLQAEVEGMRSDLRLALSEIARNTKKTAKTLDDVSNGDLAINTVAA
jgi:hypothetical protein